MTLTAWNIAENDGQSADDFMHIILFAFRWMKTDFFLPFPNELQTRQPSSSRAILLFSRARGLSSRVISCDLASPSSVQDHSDYIESRYLNMAEFNKC